MAQLSRRTSLVEATHDPLTSGPTESQHATAQRLLLLRSDPFHSLVPLDQVSQDTEGLKILLSKGAWKSVVPLAQSCMFQAKLPHHKIQFRQCIIISLMKLGNYEQAFGEFKDFGLFDEPKYLCESFPEYYHQRKGSMIPFHLRLLYAELLGYLGKDPFLDALFALLAYCQKSETGQLTTLEPRQLSLLNQSTPTPSVCLEFFSDFITIEEKEKAPKWKVLINRVRFSIASKLISTSNFTQALNLISPIAQSHEGDIRLLASISQIYFQMGNIEEAKKIILKMEKIIGKKEENSDKKTHQLLALTQRAYLDLAEDNPESAVQKFEKLIETDPHNIEAISNRALCLLHLCRLDEAIQSLETFLSNNPTNITETLIFNLCTLYDLAYMDNIDKKEKLLIQYHSSLTDGFDLIVFKLN